MNDAIQLTFHFGKWYQIMLWCQINLGWVYITVVAKIDCYLDTSGESKSQLTNCQTSVTCVHLCGSWTWSLLQGRKNNILWKVRNLAICVWKIKLYFSSCIQFSSVSSDGLSSVMLHVLNYIDAYRKKNLFFTT